MVTMSCKKNNATIASEIFTNSVRNFLEVQHAYDECSDEIQAVVRDMIDVYNAADSTEEERNGALYTIVEAVFPGLANEVCDACEQIRKSTESQEYNSKLQSQEEAFADTVRRIMKEKRITQSQLAESIGIGQSAISNLLGRNCRPQKRTIENIASALGVEVSDIWVDLPAE